MNPDPITVRDLAQELAVSPKTVRAWMRLQHWRSSVELGQPWLLAPEQSDLVRAHFGDETNDPGLGVAVVSGADPLPDLTVEQLLTSYRHVLMSLRARGLVRTSNAPIGDLAEYCAAIVYDGLLAPNSEKSYDLIAEDGRRIQVKVRLIRPDTNRAAVFSPIRSFDFDAGLFLIVDDEAGDVEMARELTVDDIREHGQHREHTNGLVMRVSQIRSKGLGVDLTAEFSAAWREMLALSGGNREL
ncbi:MAG TPA: hypothetical protein VGM70_08200 [Pseudolysinimonas sp.]|jgi:hypothetical protein